MNIQSEPSPVFLEFRSVADIRPVQDVGLQITARTTSFDSPREIERESERERERERAKKTTPNPKP